jgi:hypothetical protein
MKVVSSGHSNEYWRAKASPLVDLPTPMLERPVPVFLKNSTRAMPLSSVAWAVNVTGLVVRGDSRRMLGG